jgi:peptide chain release factor 2
MEDLKKNLASLEAAVTKSADKIKLAPRQAELAKLQAEIAQNDWSDNLHAQDIRRGEALLFGQITPWSDLLDDIHAAIELAKLNDNSLLTELQLQAEKIKEQYEELKKDLRFTGQYDDHDVILSIYAGAGGTDAQDWAQMLLRMYLRWAETQKLKAEVIDQSAGEEAGIKSATVKLSGGDFLYGRLSGEHGVHRLVRMSPFNSAGSRETSFAKVDILPLVNKPNEVQLDEKDLKVDVYRAGGHGGQSVNTTDSAVRVTHLPTAVTVSIQNERSQLQNKETALAILRSKLVQLQTEQHAQNLADIKGPNQSAEWGNQIRSYVLHPYKQVKDLRTGYETSDPDKVLNGDLEPLISAWLEHKPA